MNLLYLITQSLIKNRLSLKYCDFIFEYKIYFYIFIKHRPILKIPNLAIHLTTERNKFEPNTETHLKPIFSTEIYD